MALFLTILVVDMSSTGCCRSVCDPVSEYDVNHFRG
jgi:hypothetical protein